MLEAPDWGFASWSWFGYCHWSLVNPLLKCLLSILILKVQKHPCPSSPVFGFGWRFLAGCWDLSLDLDITTGLWYSHFFTFYACILTLKVKRSTMSLMSRVGALEDAGDSWLGFGILVLIWIWSLVFDISMLGLLALYLDFEGAQNIHVLYVLTWGFARCCRFLPWVWNLILIWIW